MSAKNLSSIESNISLKDYILGPGDFLSVSIEAVQPILLRGLVINPEGKIVSPILGQIKLQGKSLSEAFEVLEQEIRKTYINAEIELTLERPRQIFVFCKMEMYHTEANTLTKPFSRLDQALYPAFKSS